MVENYKMFTQIDFKKVLKVTLFCGIFMSSSAYGMVSSNYIISSLQQNCGSGFRSSSGYQISSDAITMQPIGNMISTNYSLTGRAIVPGDTSVPYGGVYINEDADYTNSISVTLSLLCSDSNGCNEVKISNNGVSWSDPVPYATSLPWELVDNDGDRTVFVKYSNNLDEWSGVCTDSIILNTSGPLTTISPEGEMYMNDPFITLTANEPATIYYTMDGTDPTTDSEVYTEPIVLTSDTTLKAFAIDVAGNTGAVVTEEYTVCTGNGLSISGSVIDATVNKGLPLAVITLDSGHTASTDVDGNYSFTSLPRGYYRIESITTAKPGYVTYQKDLVLCKTGIVHDVTLTKNNTVFGGETFSGYSVDSVNTAIGNYVYSRSDLKIPGRSLSFSFERSYNSLDENDGPLGFGWTHNYNITMTEGSDGDITVRWGDGRAATWVPDGSGGYTPMPGVFDSLVKNPDNTITIRQKDLIEYHFDIENSLASIEDENGNALSFSYSDDLLVSITDTSGRTISISYDASNRITRLLDPAGRSVTFTYSVNGDLVSSTDMKGNTTVYEYDSDHKILKIKDPLDNAFVSIMYDEQRRVVSSQRDALGAVTLYSYDAATKTTQIVDPYGNISYHHFDDMLRLIREEDARGNSAYYTFNERGNISRAVDKNGSVTQYAYDDNGNVLAKTDPLGNQTLATYDSNNNPLTKTDANGNTTTYTYTADANLESVTDSLGNVTSYTYDTFGQLLTVTDALGNVTTNEYDIYGNLVKVTDALGNESTFTYDIVGRKLTENHPLGRSTAYEYDNEDHLISVTDAMGNLAEFVFDANGNKIEHIDALGNKTTFAYDAKNHLISRTNPLTLKEHYTYDLMDRRIAVTNFNGHSSTIVYDAMGNIIREVDPMGNQVQHEYDANGNCIATIDARGNRSTSTYDAMNRLVSSTDALGNSETYTYDANGNRLSVTDALGNTTTYEYDELNRLVSVTDPLGNVTLNEYDTLGRFVRITDAKGRQTAFEYDALGRTVKVTDANGGEVSATYDALGNRLSLIDTRGNTTTYRYDVLNRNISETDPLGNATLTNYDAVGNVISISDSDGTTFFDYNECYRLETLTYPDMTTVTFSYDDNGNRVAATGTSGTTSYVYNKLDQIVSVTDPFGMIVGYTYDPNGNRVSIKYPGNKTVYYLFDELNRLFQVKDWSGITTEYSYDAEGRLSETTMGNGSTVSYIYDEASRLTTKEDRAPDGSLIALYEYTLDQVGNRLAMSMDQPLAPHLDYMNETFTQDAANQLVTHNSTAFTYDGKGNRVVSDDGSVTTQYDYNFDDLLTKVSSADEVSEYVYNSGGKRIASIVNGVETRYLLDLNSGMENVLAEMDSNNDVKKYYVYGDGLLYSVYAGTGERLFHHYDAIGSTVALTDFLGNVTDKYAYLPFGTLANSDTAHNNSFTYVGKFGVMQEQNGLYFMRARFYDPVTRRFLSRDPVEEDMQNTQTISPYLYVEGRPISFIDPNGEIAFELGMAYIIYECADIAADFAIYGGKHFGPNKDEDVSTAEFLLDTTFLVLDSMPIIGHHAAYTKGYLYEEMGMNPDCGIDLACHAGSFVSKLNDNMEVQKESYTQNTYGNGVISPPILKNQKSKINNQNSSNKMKLEALSKRKVSVADIILQSKDSTPRPPKKYFNVRSKASGFYSSEFAKLKDPDILDRRTRSYIEWQTQLQLNSLQNKRYGYRTKDQKQRVEAEMMNDIQQSANRFYARLTSALSKYAVLIEDLDKLPNFNSGNLNRRGVYANK